MRKIYSLALLAAALLISANGWAANVVSLQLTNGETTTTREFATMTDAFTYMEDNAQESSKVVFTLLEDVTTDYKLVINKKKDVNINLNQHNMNVTSAALCWNIYDFGKLTISGKGSFLVAQDLETPNVQYVFFALSGLQEPTTEAYSTLTIEKDVIVNIKQWGVGIFPLGEQTAPKGAYGVTLNIYGEFSSAYGITINGSIQKTDKGNFPTINVYSGAKLITQDLEGCGIYAAGYAIWNVYGYVEGGCGIYVKGGQVNLYDGAYILAKGEYSHPLPVNNGYDASGDAIVYDSHKGYTGHMELNVIGDVTVISTNGYAIHEVATSGSSTLPQLDIKGGTFKSNATGTDPDTGEPFGSIITTNEEQQKLQASGEISGGSFDESIKDYISSVNGTVTPVKDRDGNTTYVVENVPDKNFTTGFDNAGKDSYVELDGITMTLDKSIEVAYIKMINGAKLFVKKGVTLTIGGAVIDEASVLAVNAGGKLVVTAKGITAWQESNIVVETEEGNEAIILFSPTAVGSTHPYATVEFLSKAYYVDANTYLFQRFGVPTNNLTAITCDGAIRNRFWSFDAASNSWKDLGAINKSASDKDLNTADLNNAFTYYQLMSYANAAGTKLYFKGSLAGNQDKEIAAKGNSWNGYANSYLAEMNIKAMLDNLTTAGIQPAIYLAQENGPHTLNWEPVNATSFEVDPALNAVISPMQAFLVKNFGANTSATLDYKNYVWNPAMTTGKAAPARRKVASDITSAKIIIANTIGAEDKVLVVESSRFSSDYDMEYDAVKYMNDDLNLYVTTAENNLSIMTTDNIENTYLGFSCVAGGKYAVRFANINGAEMVLTDMETGATMVMAEGQTYEFEADANTTNDYRFRITKRQDVTTSIENTVINVQETGIYSITGQYLGEVSQWNNMPSGMYIVNGEKKIK